MKAKITCALGAIRNEDKKEEAHLIALQCKKILSTYYENVSIGTHVDIDLTSKQECPELSIKKNGQYLVLCVDGNPIAGQRDLKITSALDDVSVVSVEFILSKGMLNLEEIEEK